MHSGCFGLLSVPEGCVFCWLRGGHARGCLRMKDRPMNSEQVTLALKKVPDWVLRDGAIEVWRRFSSFAGALEFVVRVGAIAEAMDHHPDLDLRFNTVRVAVCTHSAGGLTELDFEFARRADGVI